MNAPERWIVIPNWEGSEGFQHYKDRTPRWIKNYAELLHDPLYLRLTLHQRGVLHGLWLEYAAARRQIPDSTSTVSRRLGERVTRATLDSLNHAGWIEYSASKPLAPRYQDASPEKSREEKNPPNPPTGGARNGRGNLRTRARTPAEPEPFSIAARWTKWIDTITRLHELDPNADTPTPDDMLQEINYWRTLPNANNDLTNEQALEQWRHAYTPAEPVAAHNPADDIPF